MPIRERLRDVLRARPKRLAREASGTPAAVLLALFGRDVDQESPRIWLVRRAETLRAHGGQVAFPGGKREPSDPSLEATALREAHEEIGLPPDAVDVLGPLDDLVTITGFVISPYVAWVDAPFEPRPSGEVARVFSAPIALFATAPELADQPMGFDVDGEYVWGATAAIARALAAILGELAD